jgi:hypothetical protein
MTVLDGEEGVAESVAKWVGCWGASEGRTGLLLRSVWELVG